MTATQPAWAARSIAFATMHQKERQFGPSLLTRLGVELVVADLDTDQFGTFTGEVGRPADQVGTALVKAHQAIEQTDLQFGLASEGAYGPHPDAPFVPIGIEVAAVVDCAEEFVVVERLVCHDTNFAHIRLTAPEVPNTFLDRAGFPEHGLIVSAMDATAFTKGICDREQLDATVRSTVAATGAALVQTDMRAHLNPTRQRHLITLAERLAHRLATACPACGAPGWGVVGHLAGQPCEWCDRPTSQVAADRLRCARASCGHEELHQCPGLASPGHCEHCNP